MRYRCMFRAVALVALIAAVGVTLTACGGGGTAGTKNSQDLFLKKMLLIDQLENTDITQPGPPTYSDIGGDGTTNAFRDSKILLVFNTAIDIDTVSIRTIQIGLPTGNNLLIEAQGRFEPVAKEPSWVLFNPTYKTEYDPNDPDREADNPFGMDGNAIYSITIPKLGFGGATKVVQNTAGHVMARTYMGEFATSSDYIQTFTQPEIVKTNPLNGSIEVDARADVDLTFSEPMKPSSFRLGDTVIIRNTDTGRNVLGTLRFSADARTVTFRPVFGYGPGPYDIFVRVTTDVTNLSGNKIPKEVRLEFRTEQDDTVPTLIDIIEPFDDNVHEDTNYITDEPLADWAGGTPGYLAGRYATGSTTFKPSTGFLYPPWGWGQNYSAHAQTFWHASEVAPTARTLTGYDWYYLGGSLPNTPRNAVVTNVTIKLGHHEPGELNDNPLTTNWANNYKDSPVTVVSNLASYTIPLNAATGSWLAGPTFSNNFKYNGRDNLLFELYVTTDSFGLRPLTSTPSAAWGYATDVVNRTLWSQPSWFNGGITTTFGYQYDVRFYWLVSSAEAQSLFYDTKINSPTYLATLIDPSIADQPAGTSTTILYQGAPDDIDNPDNADADAASEWYQDLEKVSGYRYLRFNVRMQSNQSTGQSPLYSLLTFPYYFF